MADSAYIVWGGTSTCPSSGSFANGSACFRWRYDLGVWEWLETKSCSPGYRVPVIGPGQNADFNVADGEWHHQHICVSCIPTSGD